MSEREPTGRCCMTCYHCGYFIGYEGLTCELTGKPRNRPRNYTNCKRHEYDDPLAIRTVAVGKGLRVSA